ncbi:MAG TPA: hypothetical protein VEK07_07455 [Polyangiaceae bacterium]|nr:hypothetical protein [Polyangiaceae bacterium]
MVYAYTAAAIVGLVLLVGSLLGAGHEHDAGHPAGTDPGHHESAASVLLSARVGIYFLTFGGLTGLLLRFVAPVAEPWRAAVALGVGSASALLTAVLVAHASRAGATGTVKRADLVGRVGNVLVPFQSGATGKVRVHVAESNVDLLATTDDGEPLGSGVEVLVLELRDDGAAVVTRAPK